MHRACIGVLAFAEAALAKEPTCYGFPERDFSPTNNVGDDGSGVHQGMKAPDFILKTPGGAEHSLYQHLDAAKPVVMQFGSYS